jgi:hypothetical protein
MGTEPSSEAAGTPGGATPRLTSTVIAKMIRMDMDPS